MAYVCRRWRAPNDIEMLEERELIVVSAQHGTLSLDATCVSAERL